MSINSINKNINFRPKIYIWFIGFFNVRLKKLYNFYIYTYLILK
jgi:hypothetical protein